MKINQDTFRETRFACIIAIKMTWILEAVFVSALLILSFGMLMGYVSSPFSNSSIFLSVLGVYSVLFVSMVIIGFATALMANAVVNIDSRNRQAELFDMLISKQHQSSRLQTDFEFINLGIELSGIKPERVT